MPIYEFYCRDCHMIFSFLSRTVNTTRRPACPRCRKRILDKQISLFATGRGGASAEGGTPPEDGRLEKAVEALSSDMERLRDDDPHQAAELMRKFTKLTGMKLGKQMEEALGRIEKGEDPEKVEAELGELPDTDEAPIAFEENAKASGANMRREARRDPTLYEL